MEKKMRRKVIAGNWKMNKDFCEVEQFFVGVNGVSFCDSIRDTKNEVIICPPFIDIAQTVIFTEGSNIHVGAQNCYYEENGAYTGEISASMLISAGVEYVIIGHSERRKYFNETNEIVSFKVDAALKAGLKPIVCVGETLKERQEGVQKQVIENQVRSSLSSISDLSNVMIAYEPIWAIGTGKTATPEDANVAIQFIRSIVKDMYDKDIANNVIILYGGSVKASNAKALFEMPDIDGGLIGGASLDPIEFAEIVNFKNKQV